MVEHSRTNPKEGFMKTPDLAILSDALVIPGVPIPVELGIDPKTLALVKQIRNPQYINASFRSRYAQGGVDSHRKYIGQLIDQLLRGNSQADLLIHNHSQRPIALSAGTPLLRLFYDSPEAILRNIDLRRAIGQGRIFLRGQRGEDWEWASNEVGDLTGVFLRMDGDNRTWIRPHPTNEPFEIDAFAPGFRERIDALHSPVEEVDQDMWWLAQSAISVRLASSIEGILDTRVLHATQDRVLEPAGIQTNSLIMDGGYQEHHIRFEVIGPTTVDRRGNWARVHFLENGLAA